MVNPNKKLLQELRILADFYKTSGDTWRAKSYAKAIVNITNYPYKLKTKEQAIQINGVGKRIAEKIEEFAKTGKIKKVGSVEKEAKANLKKMSKEDKVINLFEGIWGVGKVKAKKLYSQGFTTIAQLRKSGGKYLTKQQRIGLKYYENFKEKIPRKAITAFGNSVRKILTKLYSKNAYQFVIAGSYRRKKKTSGDIDCLVSSDSFNLKTLIQTLEAKGIITEVLSMSSKGEKFMGVAKLSDKRHVRLDIEFVKNVEKSWWPALVYFTGSKGFNITMRDEAKKKGFKLDQHGLVNKKTGRAVRISSEEDLFKKVGMKYLPPEKRG